VNEFRIQERELPDQREEATFFFNGRMLRGYVGEPIAVALLANGIRTIRFHGVSGKPRGIYCGIGHCYECLATVNTRPGVRTCLTPLADGMVIISERPEREAYNHGDRA
jgi:sarcosine oxidase subunit alpha